MLFYSHYQVYLQVQRQVYDPKRGLSIKIKNPLKARDVNANVPERKQRCWKRKRNSHKPFSREIMYAVSLIGKARLEEPCDSLKKQCDHYDMTKFYNNA